MSITIRLTDNILYKYIDIKYMHVRTYCRGHNDIQYEHYIVKTARLHVKPFFILCLARGKVPRAGEKSLEYPSASPLVGRRAAPMASKKLEEKYQKLLKDIQRRQHNRGCFDCDSRGNQYVVLNYMTFVCTTCSGIHREMQHRTKSVGMSTFSIEEIKALDAGGNAVAKVPPDPRPPAIRQPRVCQTGRLRLSLGISVSAAVTSAVGGDVLCSSASAT